MNRLGLFLSEVLLHAKQRKAFLEWMLFLSLWFMADFLLNIYILEVLTLFNFIVLTLLVHFCYFIWLLAILAQDGSRMKQKLTEGEYDEKMFQVFLSRLIPIFFLLSPGIGGVGVGFILVFVLARPMGMLMTYRAKIDWRSVYEILRLEQERL